MAEHGCGAAYTTSIRQHRPFARHLSLLNAYTGALQQGYDFGGELTRRYKELNNSAGSALVKDMSQWGNTGYGQQGYGQQQSQYGSQQQQVTALLFKVV